MAGKGEALRACAPRRASAWASRLAGPLGHPELQLLRAMQLHE